MMNAVQHEIWATDANVAVTLTGTLEGYISQFRLLDPDLDFSSCPFLAQSASCW